MYNNQSEQNEYTKRLYWHDTYLFEHQSKVISTGHDSEKGYWVRLAETIFHPQGGGQPNDEGTINGIKVNILEESKVENKDIDYDLGIITHYLAEDPKVKIGDIVKISIDKDIRLRNSALHTAGHIAAGVLRTEYGYKKQTGANHFPEQAKIEFVKEGNTVAKDPLDLKVKQIISSGKPIHAQFQEVPDIYKSPNRGSSARCVTIEGLWTEPCSGTHLHSTKEIETFSIRGLEDKKGKLTVKYMAAYGLFKQSIDEASSDNASKPKKESSKATMPVEVITSDPTTLSVQNSFSVRRIIPSVDAIKKFKTPNGTEVVFYQEQNNIKAFIVPVDNSAPYKEIDEDSIHINLNNSPDKTILLSKKDPDWRAKALERISEISLAFSGTIVITQLSDWSFNLNKVSLTMK